MAVPVKNGWLYTRNVAMSGEKKAKGWRFYGLVGFGAIVLLSAGVWALQNKTLLFSLDDTLVNNALQTLNKTRPAMVDVIPTDGIVPLYINPQGVAKLLRNETLTSLPKNLEPVFYNAAQTLLMPKLDVLSQQPRYVMKLAQMEPGAAWQWLTITWQPL
ncbi:putative membrane associated protein [Shigella dysenteriae WRSd3]|uniref:PufY' protein n=4 Tax=Shigella dysenteriae TaxID=622 RepID=Q32DW0_SHIDS|nr:hypothetical protein SDY_2422 [Shigella dysenteriae Sd197]AHA66096.1 Putative membrane associated protein [Shigella dysenteriae 1617]ESU79032.1 putative membrane associated protein [Shigella dysenteriae WRSd3]ESU85127.1 putative membrane associated protein [Shigella dysenteriae WRSd5]RCV99205.1 hypothetical protein A0V00_17475 [Shigella dysenteriae]